MTDGRAIWARDLRVRFGSVVALRGLSLDVEWGERLAIFGPNGAGKTTLLRVLAGLLRPSGGELAIDGLDPIRSSAAVRGRLGVVSHQTYLYGELTTRENLRLYGSLYCVPSLEDRIGVLLERIGLYGRRDDRVDGLSRGLQQRLAMARAVLHDPPILLLDEPDTGLDLSALHVLEALLAGEGRPRCVLMTTHNLDHARRVCRRALVLVSGRLVGDLSAAELDVDSLSSLYQAPALVSR